MRCRSLARALKVRDVNSIFLCRDLDGNLIDQISKEFRVLSLKKYKTNETQSDLFDYSRWLGCAQEVDVKETISKLNANKIQNIIGIVIDHYSIDFRWEEIFKKNFFNNNSEDDLKLIVIDDLFNRKHYCDILIDQTFTSYIPIDNYSNLVKSSCLKLLGPSYCILDETYKKSKEIYPIRKNIKRILVYFGASDLENNSLKIAKLVTNKKYSSYNFDFVISKKHNTFNEIESIIKNHKRIKIHGTLESLAPLIGNSDLSIGAGGTTTWERLILGLPSLVIPVAKNQIYLINSLKNIGLLKVKEKDNELSIWLFKSINEIKYNLEKISIESKVLLDGFGNERICNAILKTSKPLILKKFTAKDKSLLFNLANESKVRMNSFNKSEISINEHSSWFKKVFKSPYTFIYIAYCQNNSPVGQVRFDIKKDCCFLDFSIEKASRGFGLGLELVKKGIKEFEAEKCDYKFIVAEVCLNNVSSIKIFRKLKFLEKFSNKKDFKIFLKKNTN